MHLKISSVKQWPFCPGGDELIRQYLIGAYTNAIPWWKTWSHLLSKHGPIWTFSIRLASSALLCWWLWLHHYNVTPWKMNGSNSCGLITTYTHIDRHTHKFLDMDSCPRIITSHILLVKANPLSLRLNSFWHRLVCSHFNPMWNLIGFACSLHPGNIDCENPNMHKQVPIVEKKNHENDNT